MINIQNSLTFLDGGMGTMLQSAGLPAGTPSEEWNISHPEEVIKVHTAYFNAGSNIINTNTFGANCLKYDDTKLEKIISAAIENAKTAKKLSTAKQDKFIALDIGPSGKLLTTGELQFNEAVEIFAKTVRIGVKYGVDLVFLETFTDLYETKAALLAVKENCDLPVFVSNAYENNGRLLTGTTPDITARLLAEMGADAVGFNCGSLSRDTIEYLTREYLANTNLPIIAKPNAGLPVIVDGQTEFESSPDIFAETVTSCIRNGVSLAGGCCGTTPEYIEKLTKSAVSVGLSQKKAEIKPFISSSIRKVSFDGRCILIGERLNPTGKKRLKEAVAGRDIGYITGEAIAQEKNGAEILDVNMGVPGTDEKGFLPYAIKEIQAVTTLPLQIDTSDFEAMESSMRLYNGIPLINSVCGKQESMDKIFPLMQKYGGMAVALLLDEDGIPDSIDGRMAIFDKIVSEATKYGLENRLIFDALTIPVSTDKNAAKTTLSLVEKITKKGFPTCLGVSNISFGLPERDLLNATFLAMSIDRGLTAAIVNPGSDRIRGAIAAANALKNDADNFSSYIGFTSGIVTETVKKTDTLTLKSAIVSGLKAKSGEITGEMLKNNAPLDIINNEIIPALDIVGQDFDSGKAFLPELIAAANSAAAAFGVIKEKSQGNAASNGKKFVIATVEGDVHDIGKNIVKLLLENYGFDVIDLGKNVTKEKILAAVLENNAKILGLSALMTTTVPAMENTIRLIHEKAPDCKIIVGGAVLTEDTAKQINADFYATDALATVRIAENL